MTSSSKSNHGKVGDALYIKMTHDRFCGLTKNPEKHNVRNMTVLTPDELLNYGCVASIPLYIDNDTQGDYECVCEYGSEIH